MYVNVTTTTAININYKKIKYILILSAAIRDVFNRIKLELY